MGIFSKSSKSVARQSDAFDDIASDIDASVETVDAQGASNVEALSPFALKMQEQQRKLDGLRGRILGLGEAFDQMNSLAAESEGSIHALADHIEASKTAIETEIRLRSENAKLTSDLIESNHQVETLAAQLQDSEAQLHSLRNRSTETRNALEKARDDIIGLRDNQRKTQDRYTDQSGKLVAANAELEETNNLYEALRAKYDVLEKQFDTLKGEFEVQTRREGELQQNLSENTALLEEETRRSQKATSDLSALKRDYSDARNENIDLRSKLDVAEHELDYAKSGLEEEQRKHDNEVYSLKAEIENLTSQRRIGVQSIKELTVEHKKIKERNRDMAQRVQELESLLDTAQKNHEGDRRELLGTNDKLHELNIRYNAALTDLKHERKQNEKYAASNEMLAEENKKLQQLKIKYDAAKDQIGELKALIGKFQLSREDIADFVAPSADGEVGDDGVVVKLHD